MCQNGKKILSCLGVPTATQRVKLPNLIVYRYELPSVSAMNVYSCGHKARYQNCGLKRFYQERPEASTTSCLWKSDTKPAGISAGSEWASIPTCFGETITKRTACNKYLVQGLLQKAIVHRSTQNCTCVMGQKTPNVDASLLVVHSVVLRMTNLPFCEWHGCFEYTDDPNKAFNRQCLEARVLWRFQGVYRSMTWAVVWGDH